MHHDPSLLTTVAFLACLLAALAAPSVALAIWIQREERRWRREHRERAVSDFEAWAASTRRVLRRFGAKIVALGSRSSACLWPSEDGPSRVRVVATGSRHHREFLLFAAPTLAAPLDDASDRVEWLAEMDARRRSVSSSPYR